jgi:hypothetical protein
MGGLWLAKTGKKQRLLATASPWASSLCDGRRRLRAGYTEYNTPLTNSPLTHLTAAMFVRRVATGLAKRAAFRPVAARPFSSSFARCKPQPPSAYH